MNQIKPINLSPSFMSKVLSKGYDYAVGEKLGLIKRETKPMTDGKLLHSYISAAFGGKVEKIAISPYENFRTKEAQNWRDSQPDDTLIIKEDKAEEFKVLAERVKNHPEVHKVLNRLNNIETEKRSELPVNGYNLKGFIDLVATGDEQKVVIDWKFVSSKTFDNFYKEAYWSNYDLQAAEYDILENATHIYFGVIENEAPHRIKLMFATPEFIESGSSKFERAMNIIKKENWRQPTFDIMGVENLGDWS